MKRTLVALTILALALPGCAIFKKKIVMDDVMVKKDQIDQANNPARQLVLKQELGNRCIVLKDLVVKDVTESSNIDYDFCVVVDAPTKKGTVECYVYSKSIKKIAQLDKGKTKIDVSGEFGRFFTSLDTNAVKLEIIKASVTIKK